LQEAFNIMAIVKIQAPLAGIRGKYGGMIFSANKSCDYCKQWGAPTAKTSPAQTLTRSRMATLAHAYSNLTSGQLTDWIALSEDPPELDYNSLNEQYWPSAFAWHQRINLRRLQAGQAYEANCPTNVAVDPPTTFSLTAYTFLYPDGVDKFTYTNGDFATGKAVLHIAPTFSKIRTVQTSGYLKIWTAAVEQTTWTRINEELIAAFGWLDLGQQLFGKLWHQNDEGIRSTKLETSCLILPEP
jgi:hypothetical protein